MKAPHDAEEAQVTQYMRDLTNPPKGKPQPTSQQVMQAASDITGGMIMHYSSAGRQDSVYNANPDPHTFYRDRGDKVHEFPSPADAQKAARTARASRSPDAPAGRINQMIARSPDKWSDVTSQGAPRAGRYIGDRESKMQTRLLTLAGFKWLGSVDVLHGGGIGHTLGAFKAPDGTTWVTSNEDFRQVSPSNAKVGVTQVDLDATLQKMTGKLYHTQKSERVEVLVRCHGEPADHGRSGGLLDPPLDRAGHDAPDRSADRAAAAQARLKPGRPGHGQRRAEAPVTIG
jgi:hypothetical protein